MFINDILNYIEENYNQPIAVKALEQVSLYSYRNIQRIFKYTCGETIGEYQKRLKIENGYKFMLYTQKSLSDIAFEVGFDNIASFSKAFKQYYGISPREARQNKQVLFQKNEIEPLLTTEIIPYELVYLPTQKVYYQSTKTHYLNEDIEWLWEKILSNDFAQKNIEYYGVILDEILITDKIKCRYDACVSAQAQNKALPSKNIFGGRYAKFLHHGNYESIEDTYQKIYAGWILTAALAFSPTPIIEHYIKHSDNTAAEENYVTAILIPILK